MVIETTVTLDPVKDAEIVKALREKPEWKIKKQLTTAITFHYFWHGDLVNMPLYGLKEVSDGSPIVDVVVKGNCAACGKPLSDEDGVFICKKCMKEVNEDG